MSPLRKVMNIVISWAKALIITHMSTPWPKGQGNSKSAIYRN
jgi:hypothetical protein